MSPDDVFAAQFWPWPDPAIKRDPEGRVLFVNAAFLAMYGGRVEDWRGNAVGGWPAPQAGQPAPYRFETRLPDDMNGEQVYDWIEQTMADGNAFALARNVTVFVQTPEPAPTEIANSPQDAPQQSYAPDMSATAQDMPHVDAQQYDVPQDDISMEPALAVADFVTPTVDNYTPPGAQTQSAPPEQMPDIPLPDIEIPADDAYALTQSVSVEQSAYAEPAPLAETPREFERRALPLDSESAVLGNNWRDAVIAKAVGAEDAAPPAETAQPTSLSTGDGSDKIRILLAEDNAINALLTRTLLEAEGHIVDTVEDGALAVEAMKTTSYDLIFMDMRMPNMDGLEATRKIRTLSNVSRHLPIIALTANAFDDDRNACFDSGMNDFMTKPVSAEELSEMVTEWTGEEARQKMAS